MRCRSNAPEWAHASDRVWVHRAENARSALSGAASGPARHPGRLRGGSDPSLHDRPVLPLFSSNVNRPSELALRRAIPFVGSSSSGRTRFRLPDTAGSPRRSPDEASPTCRRPRSGRPSRLRRHTRSVPRVAPRSSPGSRSHSRPDPLPPRGHVNLPALSEVRHRWLLSSLTRTSPCPVWRALPGTLHTLPDAFAQVKGYF